MVNQNVVINKLSNLNFCQESLTFLKSYLEGRTQCVREGNVSSSTPGSKVGVPQGSDLGPLLFSFYINDLPGVCNGCDVQMYTDESDLCACKKQRTSCT